MATDHGDWGGKPIVSQDDWQGGSEYGGVPGIQQPDASAHYKALTADELLMRVHNSEPTDATSDGGLPDPLKKIAP